MQPKSPAEPDGINNVAQLASFDHKVARPAYLAHVVLSTNNVGRISNWYNTVLGSQSTFAGSFQSVDASGAEQKVELDFVTFDNEHHRVGFSSVGANVDDPPPLKTLHHMAFTYAEIGDLVQTYVRLKDEGILPVRTIHHGPTVSVYYVDPDNNRVELQVDAFPNADLLNAWFRSGAFDRNPIGRTFDFDQLVERFEAGDEPAYLVSNEGFIKDYAIESPFAGNGSERGSR